MEFRARHGFFSRAIAESFCYWRKNEKEYFDGIRAEEMGTFLFMLFYTYYVLSIDTKGERWEVNIL